MSKPICKCGQPASLKDTSGNVYCEQCALELWEENQDTFVVPNELVRKSLQEKQKKVELKTNELPKDAEDVLKSAEKLR